MPSLETQPRLLTSYRVDLSYALYSGQPPVFGFIAPWYPTVEELESWKIAATYLPQLVTGVMGKDLAATYRNLRVLSDVLNAEATRQKPLTTPEFQTRLCSIQYQLLKLQGRLDNVVAETFRLAMLAILATTFQVPGNKLEFPYLAQKFRACIIDTQTSAIDSQNVMLWFLVVGAISTFDLTETWLRERWKIEVPSPMTWDEARRRLKTVVWIDAIHDKTGQEVFENLTQNRVVVARISPGTLWRGSWTGCTYELR